MVTINAMGDTCPIPVIKTQNADQGTDKSRMKWRYWWIMKWQYRT